MGLLEWAKCFSLMEKKISENIISLNVQIAQLQQLSIHDQSSFIYIPLSFCQPAPWKDGYSFGLFLLFTFFFKLRCNLGTSKHQYQQHSSMKFYICIYQCNYHLNQNLEHPPSIKLEKKRYTMFTAYQKASYVPFQSMLSFSKREPIF